MSSVSGLNSLFSALSSSSSSVDLSSILQAAMGASSPGIDVTSAVNAAVTAAEAPEQAWQSQESTLLSQKAALGQLQTEITRLDNDIQSLNSIAGPLSARTVSSSNASVISGSAASGSAPGNHVVIVNSLATTASWTSSTFASGSTPLPAGSFNISTGSGGSTTITTDGTTTLSDVASQINGDDLGLTATVITDATGSRLAVVSNISGKAANFSISSSDSSGFGFSQAVTGANASLTVDGIPIASASNSVAGAVPGLTLNLLSAAPGVEVSLGVTPDTSQASSAINQFVSDYNTAISALNAQFTFNGSSEGVLATDSMVRNLQSQLMQALDYSWSPASGSATIQNLSALGITVKNDGTLAVDSSQLNSALANHFSDVQSFFQGASLNGFANAFDQQLTSFLAPGDGAFTVDLQSISGEIADLQKSISSFQDNYITPLRTQLQSEYSHAEILLQQLPTQMRQISIELGQNSGSSGS